MPWTDSACAAPTATLLKRQKPIARSTLGMVAGRADGAECGAALAAHDEVGRKHDGARGVPRGGQRMRVHRGVGIEIMQAGRRALGLDRRDVRRGRGRGRARRCRRPGPNDGRDSRPARELISRSPMARRRSGTLGVVRPHVVQQERRMRDVGGGHDVCFVVAVQRRATSDRRRTDAGRRRRSDGWSVARARRG